MTSPEKQPNPLTRALEFLAGGILGAVLGVYFEHLSPIWLAAFGSGAIVIFLVAVFFPKARRILILSLLGVTAGLLAVFIFGTILPGEGHTGPMAPVTTLMPALISSTSSAPTFNPLSGSYDDFNNAMYDGKYDSTKWSFNEDYRGACNAVQQNGYLTITHTPSASLSGCFMNGNFDGVAGNGFQLFEAKMLISNDYQGTCCGSLSLTLSSGSFSGGRGWIGCSLDPAPGDLVAVFNIHRDDIDEFYRKLETTFNNWHTMRLQIDQNSYTVSCYIDDNLIGSAIPRDAASLKDSNFQRYLQAVWPENSTGTYQLSGRS